MSSEGHYGCPKCGCDRFDASQAYTEWGSQSVICHYTGETECDEEYDVDDVTDSHSNDGESGDMDDERECSDCYHKYTEPVFYRDTPDLEVLLLEYFEERTAERLQPILKSRAGHATQLEISEEPHASLIAAIAREKGR